jgi:acyl CoA:acetate/3-ketoacid CoA transferase
LALVGLLQRYIAGHLETTKALLRLADASHLELFTLPQGQMAQLLAAQGRGEDSLQTNICFKHAATVTENVPGAAAARRNGGLVMATASAIIPRDDNAISMPAAHVDHIVVNPQNEQAGSVPQRSYWPMFTVGAREDASAALERLRFVNSVLRTTPPVMRHPLRHIRNSSPFGQVNPSPTSGDACAFFRYDSLR